MPKLDNKTKKVVQEESSSEEEEVTTKKVKANVGTAKAAPAKGKAPAKKVESSDESEEEVIQPQKGKVAQKAVQKADQKNKKVQDSDSDTSSDEDLKKPAAKKAPVTTTAKTTKAPAKKVVESEEDSDEEEPQQPKKKAAAPAPAKGKKAVAKEESSEESEEEVKPKGKAPVKAAAKPAAKKAEIDDDVSDSDEAPKAKTTTKAPVKAAAKPVKKVEESSEEESEEEKPKAKTATKAPVKAAAKPVKKVEESEDEEEEEPVKTKTVTPVTAKPAFGAAGGFNKAQDTGAKTSHPNEVIVKGLPFAASENDIAEFFSGCEGYESVNLLKGPDGRSKGIAFARFSSEEGLQQAVALNNSDMQGRYIVVEKTVPKEQRGGNERGGFGGNAGGFGGARGAPQDFSQKTPRDPNSSSIFIGNLSYQTTEQSLRRMFESCGEIYGLRIAMDQDGRPRGFAHVDFTAPDAVDKAVALAGSDLDGRAIRVDFSAGKKQGGFGGGGQGGFGGQGGYGGGQGGFGGRGGRAPGQGQRMNLSEDDAAKKKGSISSFSGQKQRL